MIQRVPMQLLAMLLSVLVFSSCSKDDNGDADDNDPSETTDMPAEVSDPADLQVGEAEFAAGGTETFTFTNASSSWNHGGYVGFSGRKYTMTEVVIFNEDEDVRLRVVFYVHDPDADIDGGEMPEAGAFDIGLGFTELSSEDTETFAEVYVNGEGVDYYYNDNDSEGSAVITSFDGDVLEGYVNATGMSDDDNEEVNLNLTASFKAGEE